MAYVAWGRFEGFYEYALNPWDVAAGIAIVRAAGGKCTTFSGDEDLVFGDDILATNEHIHEDMMDLIGLHFLKDSIQ